MLYPPLYVRPPRERFWTDQDRFRLRDRGCARRARLGPVFPFRRYRGYARLALRRNSAVQDAAGPRLVPVFGRTGGPPGAPHAPGPRRALPVAAAPRRRPGRDGSRRHGREHTGSRDHLAGDVPGRPRAGLRRRGSAEDRRLRKRGPRGDPAVPQRARGFAREDQGSPATGTDFGSRSHPSTANTTGPRPLDRQLRPARGPAWDGGWAGRGAPWP